MFLVKRFLYFIKRRIIRYYHYFFLYKIELIKIKKYLKKKNFILIYDYQCSPARIGHYIIIAFLVRFFSLKKYQTEVIFVYEKNISEELNKLKKKIDYYNKSAIKIIKAVSFKTKISFKNWNEVSKLLLKRNNYIFFKKKVKQRRKIYKYFNFFINYLVINESDFFIKKYKISSKLFFKYSNKKINKFCKSKYITIQVRRDLIENLDKNTNGKYLKDVILTLLNNFKEYKICIISDLAGTRYVKLFFKKIKFYSKKLYFSKDLQTNIKKIEDKGLSDMYLMLKASNNISTNYSGGNFPILWASSTPFFHFGYFPTSLMIEYYEVVSQYKRYKFNDYNKQHTFSSIITKQDNLIHDYIKKYLTFN